MYGPDVTILLIYGSHDMRHISFPQVDGGQRDPRVGASHILKYFHQNTLKQSDSI